MTFNGGKIFVELNIKETEKKDMKTNEVVSIL